VTLHVGVVLGVYIVYMRLTGSLNPVRLLIPLCLLTSLSGTYIFLTGILAYIMVQVRNESIAGSSEPYVKTTNHPGAAGSK